VTGLDAGGVVEAAEGLHASLLRSSGLPAGLVDVGVVGVPGVVSSDGGPIALAGDIRGLGERDFGAELEDRLGLPVTLENDVNLAALGEQWRGVAQGVDDFVFVSIGTGLGAGVVLDGRLHRGRHGAAGELDYSRAGRVDETDPSASAISAFAAELARDAESVLEPPYDTRSIFGAARAGDAVALAVVEEAARRISLHVVPVASSVDVSLVVLGGGIGANGDLLLEPVRRLLAEWLPFPPRVEVSTLGHGAVLTGALATGLRVANESVFTRRARA
jgi:predicted NBD/HSP70 family sugar kinase